MSAHPYLHRLGAAELARPFGFVRRLSAHAIEASGPSAPLGAVCEVERADGHLLPAEVVAVDEEKVVLVPFEQGTILPGARVSVRPAMLQVEVGDGFAGRGVDALGRPMDGLGPVSDIVLRPPEGAVPPPMARDDSARILPTGIRAIDGLLTLREGQRIGVFAASGVGKTSFIEQLAAQTQCDRLLFCLVGERGREVEAIWRTFAARKDASRFTMVAATSDQSAPLRARAAGYALALAEYWRDQGEHVVLIVDSVTRYAMALREIGLAGGAPPTVRAYPPNVFAALPRLVERCGALRSGGAITAIMTVLSETDDVDDPIVEVMKSLLDGHIVLSRSLAEQGHYPAIDVTRSVSRGSERLMERDHAKAVREVVAMLAVCEESRVMIESGVYRRGTNPQLDRAIAAREPVNRFLRQPLGEAVDFSATCLSLQSLLTPSGIHA